MLYDQEPSHGVDLYQHQQDQGDSIPDRTEVPYRLRPMPVDKSNAPNGPVDRWSHVDDLDGWDEEDFDAWDEEELMLYSSVPEDLEEEHDGEYEDEEVEAYQRRRRRPHSQYRKERDYYRKNPSKYKKKLRNQRRKQRRDYRKNRPRILRRRKQIKRAPGITGPQRKRRKLNPGQRAKPTRRRNF